jgi:hypothetical protein
MAGPGANPNPDYATKVSQGTIDSIKKMGMAAALKQYNAGGNSPEFKTAMERYYSPQRLKASSVQATNTAAANSAKSDSGNITPTTAKMNPSASGKPGSIPMPPSAPSAAARAVAPKKIDTAIAGGIPKAIGKLFAPGKGPATPPPPKGTDTAIAGGIPKAIGKFFSNPKQSPQQKSASDARYQQSKVDIQKMK